MLLSSKLNAYAHAIKTAESGRKSIEARSAALGLTLETALETQALLHTFNVAEGLDPAGRKVISETMKEVRPEGSRACLGHLYGNRIVHAEDDTLSVRLRRSARFMVEPKLILRLSATPDHSTSLEQFAQMFESVALAIEVLQMPFKEGAWTYEDQVCANGFGSKLIVGEAKTLSRASRRNFSEVIGQSVFSLSHINAAGSQLVGYAPGRHMTMTSTQALHQLMQQHWRREGRSPLVQGDVIALNALCAPNAVSAGDEWMLVGSGIELGTLRIRFEK